MREQPFAHADPYETMTNAELVALLVENMRKSTRKPPAPRRSASARRAQRPAPPARS